MARQSFVWTTLPNGFTEDGASLRLSVLLSPRLHPPLDAQQLGSFFPDWEDWPARLATALFQIRYGTDEVTIPATQTTGPLRVDDRIGLPDSSVWMGLFKDPKLPVRGFVVEDRTNEPVLSYDTVALDSLLRDLYGRLAGTANGGMPKVSDILDDPRWRHLVETVAQLDREFTHERGLRNPDKMFEHFREGDFSVGDPDRQLLASFALFHTPLTRPVPTTDGSVGGDDRISARWLEYQQMGSPKKEDLPDTLDFHQVLSAMNSYPTLLRRLGVVVDVVVPKDAFKPALDAPLSTIVTFDPGALQVPRTPDLSPVTHAALSDTAFHAVSDPLAAPSLFRVHGGLVDLSPSRFALIQADPDGSGMKLMSFLRTLIRLLLHPEERIDPVTRFEKEIGVPALRAGGLMLIQRERDAMLKSKFETNLKKDEVAQKVFALDPNSLPPKVPPPMPPELWAEDLVRGFRFDIWDSKTTRWRSLCRREATYELGGVGPIVPNAGEEESTVRLAATRSPDPTSNADIVKLHEAVVAWEGWSLAAPPPGRVISPDGSSSSSTDAELPPGIDFRSHFQVVPRSLPRLRYGREYSFRARAVDLAGNSLPPPDDIAGQIPGQVRQRFLRLDPIQAPVIALVKREDGTTERPKEGESMLRMAIRTLDVPVKEVARRYGVPPQVSAKEAEYDGALDAAGRVDATKFDLLANQKDSMPPTRLRRSSRRRSLCRDSWTPPRPTASSPSTAKTGP